MAEQQEDAMSRFLKRIWKELLLGFSYGVGLVLGVVLLIALLIPGLVDIQFPERRPRRERNMIIAANHQSFWAAFIIPILFVSEWAVRPRKWGPYSTPDATNFGKRKYWFFRLVAGRAILVPRDNKIGILRAFVEMVQTLKDGGRIIFFPEGGRTFSEEAMEIGVWMKSVKGKDLRPLKDGIGFLSYKSGASVLTVWVEWNGWGWRSFLKVAPLTVKIGQLLRFREEMPAVERTAAVQDALLRLADE